MRPLLERALVVLGALPATRPLQCTVLAARLLDGDPHALDIGTPLHGLTLSLLAAAAGVDSDASPREVWASWNVLVDPISSNVAALNLPLVGHGPAAATTGAARGTHVILTYGQLAAAEVSWAPGVPCFSCENPSVLVAAERELGDACPPLVCTGGRPSDAVRLLFSILGRDGVRVRHHGDFDGAGVQILRDLETRYGARPWRFDVQLVVQRRRTGCASAPPALAGGGRPPASPRAARGADDRGAGRRPASGQRSGALTAPNGNARARVDACSLGVPHPNW